jgi:MFS transporter, FHS family, glucose/mannose:H+ symporter
MGEHERHGSVAVRMAAYLSYVVLAAPFALLGVAWTGMRTDLDLSVSALALLAVPLTVARAAGGLTAPRWLDHVAPPTAGIGGLVVLAGGCLGWAAAPSPALAIVGALAVGYGGGLLEAVWSVVVPLQHGVSFTARLHGSYGAGAVLAPLVLTAAGGPDRWRWVFGGVSIAALCVAAAVAVTRHGVARVVAAGPAGPLAVVRAAWTYRRYTVIALLVAAVEVTGGQWGPTVLEDRVGLGETAVGVAAALYWAALTAVRLSAPRLVRVRPQTVLAPLGAALGTCAAALVAVDAVAAGALVAMAAGIALVFPTLVSVLAARATQPSVGVSSALLAGSTGATAGPALASVGAALVGLGAVVAVLTVLAAGAAVTSRALRHE